MKVFFVGTIFLFFGVVLGAENCCTPRQWEGKLGEWGGATMESGHPKMIEETAYYAYDEINQRVASAVEVDSRFIRTIGDFNEKKLYVIYGSHCKYYRLRQPFPQACTGNATSIGSFAFGVGSESLKLNLWKTEVQGIHVAFTTTPRNCIPVTEAISGKVRKEYFVLTLGFYDVTLGIKDPRIFHHPSSCEPANWIDVDEHFEDLDLSSAASYMLKKSMQ